MYSIKFSIGDWSYDGHSKQATFTVQSNEPVEVLREIYFKACENLGVRLDGHEKLDFDPPCSDYEDSMISEAVINRLVEKGVKIPKGIYKEEPDSYKYYVEDTDSFLELILAVLRNEDPKLQLDIVPDNDTFHFYGFDKQKRHIGYFGYGLFT